MSVYCHNAYRLVIRSGIPLPELTPTPETSGDVTFELLAGAPAGSAGERWARVWTLSDGRPWLSTARRGTGHLLRFEGLADFAVDGGLHAVGAYAQPGTPVETVRHLFLDQVLPLMLAHGGALVLHASAVASPAGVLAFAGPSGSGKSTLAAGFAASGAALVADDALVVEWSAEGARGVPAYPGLRLWPDACAGINRAAAESAPVAHYTEKRRVTGFGEPFRFLPAPAPLARVYVLERAPEDAPVRIAPLSRRDCLVALLSYSYRLDLEDRGRLTDEFGRLAAGGPALAIRRLDMPGSLARQFEVREAIEQDVGL